MPIRAENVARYPKNWPEISGRTKNRARWKCEACGVAHGAIGGRRPNGTFVPAVPIGTGGLRSEWPAPRTLARCVDGFAYRIIRIVLTVAHLDHQPENCSDE